MPAICYFLNHYYRCSLYNDLLIWSFKLYVLFPRHIVFHHEKNIKRKRKMIRDDLQRRGAKKTEKLDDALDLN